MTVKYLNLPLSLQVEEICPFLGLTVEALQPDLEAVSYTHLDVYKRQILSSLQVYDLTNYSSYLQTTKILSS